MRYNLITNSVDTDQVVERTIDGDRHLVAQDVTFIRPMRLAGGYVPSEHVANSAPKWADIPLTVNHPRNADGDVVSANSPIGREVTVGTALDPTREPSGAVSADLAVNVDRAEEIGGEALDIVDALENGDPLEVSSQYFADPLPAGVYDGKHRANVEGNLQPDSIALLPNKQGVCSLPECGFAPDDAGAEAGMATANSDGLRVPLRANATHDGEEMANADVSEGDIVTWPSQGDRPAAGVVKDIAMENRLDSEIAGDAVVTPPAALIRLHKPTGESGEWERTSTMVGHKLETLTVRDEFPTVSGNRTDDPVSPERGPGEGAVLEETMHANQLDFALTDVQPDDVDEYTDEEWDGDAATAAMPNPSENDEAPATLDAAHLLHPTSDENRDSKANWKLPFREGPDAPVNTRSLVAAIQAINGARGGVDAPKADLDGAHSRVVDLLVDAPDDLFGSVESEDAAPAFEPAANALTRLGRRVASALGLTDESQLTMGAESPADAGSAPAANSDPTNESGDNMEREKLINEITSNSAITAESLEDACDERVQALHDDVVDSTDPTGNGGSTGDELAERLDAIEEQMVTEDGLEDVVANAQTQSEKEELAQEIVANSAEYEDSDEVLEDFPTEAALETKRDDVTNEPVMPGATGATGNADLGGGDDLGDIDVSSGVLTDE